MTTLRDKDDQRSAAHDLRKHMMLRGSDKDVRLTGHLIAPYNLVSSYKDDGALLVRARY